MKSFKQFLDEMTLSIRSTPFGCIHAALLAHKDQIVKQEGHKIVSKPVFNDDTSATYETEQKVRFKHTIFKDDNGKISIKTEQL